MRKTYTGEYKTKAVIELLQEAKTVSQISSEFEVHPNQLNKWKKVAIEALPKILDDGRKKGDKENEELRQKIRELYEEVGELTIQLNWLKKKSGIKL
jgi:transposase